MVKWTNKKLAFMRDTGFRYPYTEVIKLYKNTFNEDISAREVEYGLEKVAKSEGLSISNYRTKHGKRLNTYDTKNGEDFYKKIDLQCKKWLKNHPKSYLWYLEESIKEGLNNPYKCINIGSIYSKKPLRSQYWQAWVTRQIEADLEASGYEFQIRKNYCPFDLIEYEGRNIEELRNSEVQEPIQMEITEAAISDERGDSLALPISEEERKPGWLKRFCQWVW